MQAIYASGIPSQGFKIPGIDAIGSLLAFALLVAEAVAAPYKPTSDAEVIERLPLRPQDVSARNLAELRRALEASPQDPLAAAALVDGYFDLAMARGDPRYVGYAEAVLGRFAEPLPPTLKASRALLRQYRHDFRGALADLDAALAAAPDFAQAQAWRAAIFLVQADYRAAGEACTALEALGRPVMSGGCRGLLAAYRGKLAEAAGQLQLALSRATDVDQRRWLLTRLGEVAAWRGDPATAEGHYRSALALRQDDVYLLAAWGDFLLDAGRPAEVMRELGAWESVDGLLLRLAEAAKRIGHRDVERLTSALEQRFAAARQRGDTTHRAEEARFLLHLRSDAVGAVAVAAANYQVQREPRDARVLLEAAVAAGDGAAARPVRDWLTSSGFEDAHIRRLADQVRQLDPR